MSDDSGGHVLYLLFAPVEKFSRACSSNGTDENMCHASNVCTADIVTANVGACPVATEYLSYLPKDLFFASASRKIKFSGVLQ